jgi:hypothetical protein
MYLFRLRWMTRLEVVFRGSFGIVLYQKGSLWLECLGCAYMQSRGFADMLVAEVVGGCVGTGGSWDCQNCFVVVV